MLRDMLIGWKITCSEYKASDPAGRLTAASLQSIQNWISVESAAIRDTGVGIPPELNQQILVWRAQTREQSPIEDKVCLHNIIQYSSDQMRIDLQDRSSTRPSVLASSWISSGAGTYTKHENQCRGSDFDFEHRLGQCTEQLYSCNP